ncbi:unnamed protein product [Mytilus edulis]|uniref:Chromo domain-containing protein n=1 Tax=Mytilus edulis TaxID=6550 RepID=A0A8S3SCS5_MYTED|nr:unnamed protein product [Mytilus edulis]
MNQLKIIQNNFMTLKKLLQCRKYKGEPQFLVKWVGFKEKTWEPEQNLPIQLVRQFLATKTQGVKNWLHTFEIPIPHKISSVQFPRCDIVHQNCHILNQVISQLSAVRTGVTANINNTIDVIRRLVKKADFNLDTRSQSRSKRGLFDFIGSISRSLFGTATVKDVQKLARHINILAERNNKFAKTMSHHDEELSSFMTNTDSRFSNLMRGIQKNYDSIQNVTFETAKFVAHFEDVSLKLSNLFIDQMNDSSVITKYLEELNIGIHEMVKGKLSPFLISPKILNDAIKHIKLILSDKFKVPVNVTSTHATQILDLPEYLVVTHNNQYYASLSFDKLRSCSGTNTLYCSHSLPLVSAVKTNCISSLYFNAKSDIHKQCDFRFLLNAIQPSIEQIFDNTLLVYKTNTLAFECQNKHSIVKGCNFCFIHIPCRCSLSTDSIFVPKKIENCQNNTDTITVLHPVNLALIQHFFSHETYNSILGDTVFTKSIKIDIPKIHIFNHTFSNILAQDKILHLSLKRIAKATQKERTVFTSLSEPLLDGKITVDNSWLDLSTILAMVALADHTAGILRLEFDSNTVSVILKTGTEICNQPHGIAIVGTELIYSDVGKRALYKIKDIENVSLNQPDVVLFAGKGEEGNEDGLGKDCQFSQPSGICTEGNTLFFTDSGSKNIRLVTPVSPMHKYLSVLRDIYKGVVECVKRVSLCGYHYFTSKKTSGYESPKQYLSLEQFPKFQRDKPSSVSKEDVKLLFEFRERYGKGVQQRSVKADTTKFNADLSVTDIRINEKAEDPSLTEPRTIDQLQSSNTLDEEIYNRLTSSLQTDTMTINEKVSETFEEEKIVLSCERTRRGRTVKKTKHLMDFY